MDESEKTKNNLPPRGTGLVNGNADTRKRGKSRTDAQRAARHNNSEHSEQLIDLLNSIIEELPDEQTVENFKKYFALALLQTKNSDTAIQAALELCAEDAGETFSPTEERIANA